MRRSAASADLWEIYVSVHNYGVRPRSLTLTLDFGPPGTAGRVAGGSRRLTLAPGADQEATFEYQTSAAGILGVALSPHDAFPADDQAELELPSQPTLQVTVYSTEPDLLRPVLSATPRVAAVYRKPEEYRARRSGPGDPRPLRSTVASVVRFPLDRASGPGLAHPGAHHRGTGAAFRAGTPDIRLSRGPAHQGFQARQDPRIRSRPARRAHRRGRGRTGDRGSRRANPRSSSSASTRRSPPCATS